MRTSRVMRNQRKNRYFILKILLLSVLFVAAFTGGRFIAGILNPDASPAALEPNANGDLLPVDRLNVLLLGIDARPGEKDARTDSMILVSIDRATKKIAMVSIPRDTIVEIPGHGQEKINSANVYGGVDLARESVENLLGVKIPYYVKTNFDGFKDIVDTLGGVTIDVEKRMVYRAEGIDLYPGTQRLDGYNALGYVRFRYDTLGDISRTERQQKFLTALAKEILQASSIIKLPKLVPEIMTAVNTNLSLKDMLFLSRVASGLDTQNIATATVPGIFYNSHGSYWKADEAKAKLILDNLFSGTKVATVEGSYSEPNKVVHKRAKDVKPVDSTAGKQPSDSGQQSNNGQPPVDGQPPTDGQYAPDGQYVPGGQNGTPGTPPESGNYPGDQTGSGQPTPPAGQPVNPPVNQPTTPPSNQPDSPPANKQSGSTGTVPQQPPAKPPKTTGGSVPGAGEASVPGAGEASVSGPGGAAIDAVNGAVNGAGGTNSVANLF